MAVWGLQKGHKKRAKEGSPEGAFLRRREEVVILGVNHRGNDATRALKRTVILTNLP